MNKDLELNKLRNFDCFDQNHTERINDSDAPLRIIHFVLQQGLPKYYIFSGQISLDSTIRFKAFLNYHIVDADKYFQLHQI